MQIRAVCESNKSSETRLSTTQRANSLLGQIARLSQKSRASRVQLVCEGLVMDRVDIHLPTSLGQVAESDIAGAE